MTNVLHSRCGVRWTRAGFWIVGLIGLALLLNTTSIASATPKAIIMVTSLSDGAANAANCPGLACRLRDAIAAANPGDEIQFSVWGTITLVSGELDVDKNLTITGPTLLRVTIDGNKASHVFSVGNRATLTLQNNLTITNGSATNGGGIYVRDDTALNLTNVTVSGNQAGLSGGGIYTKGNITLNNVTITNNDNSSGDQGGGIYVGSTSTASLTNVTVSINQAGSAGGGIWTAGTLTLNNVTVHSNSVRGDHGSGGGIGINSGSATLTNVTVRDNQCTGTPCSGGGISNHGQLTITQSAVTGNSATDAAGIGNGGSSTNATLTNVTISGNICSDGTGIWGCGFSSNNDATATLTNVTIAYNTSPVHAGIGIAVSSSATLRNTIVASNTAENCYKYSSGTLTSSGYNLSSDTTCSTYFNQPSDLNNTDPLLAALALNSPGTTKTHALLASSPALDKIPSAGGCGASVTTDQRGVARPQNSLCDIGAYELVPTLFLPLILR